MRPFNEYYACTGFGGFGTFITGAVTSTQEAMLADDFSIQPNPLRAGQSLTVQLSANEAFRANFTLYSMTGQTVQTLGQQSINVGDNQFDLPAQQTLPAGMYLLEMRTASGLGAYRKVVVQ